MALCEIILPTWLCDKKRIKFVQHPFIRKAASVGHDDASKADFWINPEFAIIPAPTASMGYEPLPVQLAAIPAEAHSGGFAIVQMVLAEHFFLKFRG